MTGAAEPEAAAERTAGVEPRSSPGRTLQQGAAFRTWAFPPSAAQEPQRSTTGGIFMPQLMLATAQGAATEAANAKSTNVERVRLMGLIPGSSSGWYPEPGTMLQPDCGFNHSMNRSAGAAPCLRACSRKRGSLSR